MRQVHDHHTCITHYHMSKLQRHRKDPKRRRPQGKSTLAPQNTYTKRATDIDPEDDHARFPFDDNSDSSENELANGGREHYQAVGKSKLRKPDQPKLDPKYGGVAVSRTDLDDDNDPLAPVDDSEDEDPFAIDQADDAISEDSDVEDSEELEESVSEEDYADASDVQKSSTRHNQPSGSADEDMSDDSASTADEDDQSDSDTSMEDTTSIAVPSNRSAMKAAQARRVSEAALVSSMAASATDQARKGAAVQQQQDAHDHLLDSRIKLQKALTSSNQLESTTGLDNNVASAAEKAREAALNLWSTIDQIRCDILAHNASSEPAAKKRKLVAAEPLEPSTRTPLLDLHNHSESLEATSVPHRQSILNHWYTQTRPRASTLQQRSALDLPSSTEDTISNVLTTHLQTQLPKLISTSLPTPTTYDDSPFYQSLLTSLIASRTNAANISASLPSTSLPPSKNTKVKKNVDTKASKGRKIRYTVHEKLENFMAPEDRTTWTEEGRREFFGSLFGQILVVNGSAEAESDDDRDDRGTDGLRLFGGVGVA